jgi:uncharacterized protein
MQPVDPGALSTLVLWAAFALAVLFGAIAQRTHFCTMGAVSDIVNMGDWARMRMWVMAIGVAVLGFNAMVALGWVDASKSVYAGPRFIWLSALVGGLMFGFGMVLASGCGSKTLVRLGAGNLKSLVVFIVLGLAAFATLKGITGVARVATVDSAFIAAPTGQDLPSLLAAATGLAKPTLAAVLGLGLGGLLIGWALARPEGRSADVLLAGLGVGALVVALWWVSGRLGHLAEDPNTLQEAFVATNSQRMESFTFVAPIAYTLDWLILFSDKSKLLTLGIVTTAGVVVGSALHAVATRSVRWEGFRDAQDTADHLIGASLMGVGGVTALGCTIGQGLSGISTLSLTSFVALAAIIAGAVAALRFQIWRVERAAYAAVVHCAQAAAMDLADPAAPDLERRFGALRRLYGDAGYERVRSARVAIVGVGGVGSWAAEALARCGVASLTLIDLDHVAESNVNRQVQALGATLGQAKVLALRERIADIHPACAVHCIEEFVDASNWPALIAQQPVDAVIDACDQLAAKAVIAAAAMRSGSRLVAGAAGGKRRPELVQVDDLARVTHDPLLAALRQRLRKHHGAAREGTLGVRCVSSREAVSRPGDGGDVDGSLNCSGYGSSVTVTATFGLVAASVALESLLEAAAEASATRSL